jgi:hypothetical protein
VTEVIRIFSNAAMTNFTLKSYLGQLKRLAQALKKKGDAER